VHYETAKKQVTTKGLGLPTAELMDRQSPELLFFERSLDWLAEGGRLGIVLPKAFLDTSLAFRARELLFEKAYLNAVITLHKDSFQPDTGVRTCIVLLTKKTKAQQLLPDRDYEIYMAASQKVGQSSEGEPIFVVDDDGAATDVLDHDLDEIVDDYKALQHGKLTPSQFRYSIKRSDVDDRLNINPQFYSPHLNESIATVRRFDELDGWSVTTLSQLEKGISIFKGPRLKTENVIVKHPSQGTKVVGYFTPSAMLQDKRDSAKYVDLAKASKKQVRDFDTVTVHKGDLLLTRSGTIGRLAYVSSVMDGQIVSDDMIRVRIPTERGRAYVAAFLLSENAAAQMLMNEYGSVQQHLEPSHVRDLLIPVPDDWFTARDLIDSGRAFITFKERADVAMQSLREFGFDHGMGLFLGDEDSQED